MALLGCSPTVGLVSGLTDRVMDPDQALDGTYWHRQAAGAPLAIDGCAETLAGLGVDVVIEIGRDAVLVPLLAEAWPKTGENAAAPILLSSQRQSSGGEEAATEHADSAFVEAVARVYEAGLSASFAGETRHRISLPGYPFEPRRYWLPKPGRRTTAST